MKRLGVLGAVKWLAILLSLHLLAACSGSPTLSESAAPDARMGYLVGRFTLKTYPRTTLLHLRIQLLLDEINTNERIAIEFDRDGPIAVLPAKPGTYEIRHVAFMSAEGSVMSQKDVPVGSTLSGPFRVEAGRAYYLADFEGSASSAVGYVNAALRRIYHRFSLDSWQDNYEKSVDEFRAHFPRLAQTQVARALSRNAASGRDGAISSE